MKSNKGFSIVEVLVSMVVIAFVAIFVATFFAFHNKVVTEAKKVTDSIFEVQDQIEQAQRNLIEDIRNGSADAYPSHTYKVFGKDVVMKLISSRKLNSDGSTVLSLDTGISVNYAVNNPEPVRPKLTSVDVTIDGCDKVIYFPDADDTAEVTYVKDPSTISAWYKNLYQWYASPVRIHGLPLVNDSSDNNVYPEFPWDLDIISLQSKKTLPGTDIVYPEGESSPKVTDFKGRFLACAVTPGSYEGYMGSTYVDMVYVSALPELEQGEYKILIDPSLIQFSLPNGFSGDSITTNNILSEKPVASINSYLSSSSPVTVNLDGANTSNNDTEGREYYSRYITFDSVKMSVNSLNAPSGSVLGVYAVARSSVNTGTPVLQYIYGSTTTNIISLGDNADQSIYPEFADGVPSWYLISGTYTTVSNDSTRLKVGSPSLDLAELVIVLNPSEDDDIAIKVYLLEKYGIE